MLRVFTGCLVLFLTACASVETTTVTQTEPDKVQVSKSISHHPSGATGLKRKVAIARFSNETRYGRSIFLNKSNDQIGKQAVDILSGKLLATEKFILLERVDMEKINKELKLGHYNKLKNAADYLIIGSVTEFGRNDTGDVGIFSRTKKQNAFAKVTIRLVDVNTGEIIYSEDGEGTAFSEAGTTFGVGAQAGYDASLNDKALDAAITNLASNVIENLLQKPWRGYILGYNEGSLIISGGTSQNIKTGKIFVIMKKGKRIKNPQTNMYISLPGKQIGELETVSSTGDTPRNEVTFSTLISGHIDQYIKKNDFSDLYIIEKN
ncbi:MAG: curli production assembly protein CsgG [Gammaproteobacteria bacterium]|nr:curli production assembly protein CsgG [Gammaproteobacteria bacterium]